MLSSYPSATEMGYAAVPRETGNRRWKSNVNGPWLLLRLLLHSESSAQRLSYEHQHDQQCEYDDAEGAQLGE